MTVAAFDPRLIEQYEDPRYLIHFQWRDILKVLHNNTVEKQGMLSQQTGKKKKKKKYKKKK
jgi:hypothetical protein